MVPHLPAAPKAWIVAGGGARNRTLMKMLAAELAPASVETADEAGWSADALEAQAFAYLAVRTLNDLPITFPNDNRCPFAASRRRGREALSVLSVLGALGLAFFFRKAAQSEASNSR